MVEILKFNEDHLANFTYDGAEQGLAKEVEVKETVKLYDSVGDVYTAIVDGKTVAIGGIYPVLVGVGQAFLFFNQEAKAHAKTIFKSLKEYIDALIKKNDYHRVQLFCLEGGFAAKNLARHLGFKKRNLWRLYVIGE